MEKIVAYSKCSCGAITIYFLDGGSNSMRPSTKKKLGIDLRKYKKLNNSYYCNHCVNHYGIDICECGSGKPVGKCECGSNKSLETFGETYDGFAKMLENFGCNG